MHSLLNIQPSNAPQSPELDCIKTWIKFILEACSNSPKSFAHGIELIAEQCGIEVKYRYPKFWEEKD